jgi:hypothetical protein
LYVFKLDLFPLTVDGGAVGEFEIRTNHPEKRKITVRGRIGLLALKLRKEKYRLSLFAGRKVTVN